MRKVIFGLATFVWSSLALAQAGASTGCEIPGQNQAVPDPPRQLVLLVRFCLGTDKDQAQVVKDMSAALKGPALVDTGDSTPAPTTVRLVKAVDVLLTHASGTKAVDAEAWSAVRTELINARGMLNSLKADESSAVWFSTVEKALPAQWKMPAAGLPIFLGGNSFDLLTLPPDCVPERSCPAFEPRADLLRVINLAANLQAIALRPSLKAAYEDATLQRNRWKAYRADAQPLYFWEVGLNSMLMRTNLLGKPCEDRDYDGVRRGFCEVPTRQIILLHPEGALRFSRSAAKTDELKQALLIQVVGVYNWGWKAESGTDGAKMTDRWGASLAASYTNTSSAGAEGRWGYGPMVHLGDYSLAVTKASGGKWSVVVNIPLAGAYFGRRQEVVDSLSKLK